MILEVLLAAYVVVAIVVGVRVFVRAISWLPETDRVMPLVSTGSAVAWGILAIAVALIVEGAVLRSLWGTSAAFIALAIVVGPVEEGAKLLPYVLKRNEDVLRRWNLTVKTALVFGIVEGIMYFLLLFFRGDVLGAFFRLVVIAFHVLWTAMALEEALKGNTLLGYARASLTHGLYDAPMLVLLAGWVTLAGPLALAGMAVLLYMNRSLDPAFRFAYDYARRVIERRRKAEDERMRELLGDELTSWP